MKRLALILCWLAFVANASPDLARRDAELAQRAYDARDFERAGAEYAEAYRQAPLPGFLFNLGQCERQLGHRERAASYFRRYLELAPAGRHVPFARELLREVQSPVPTDAPRAASNLELAPGQSASPVIAEQSSVQSPLRNPWVWAGAAAVVVTVVTVVAVASSTHAPVAFSASVR